MNRTPRMEEVERLASYQPDPAKPNLAMIARQMGLSRTRVWQIWLRIQRWHQIPRVSPETHTKRYASAVLRLIEKAAIKARPKPAPQYIRLAMLKHDVDEDTAWTICILEKENTRQRVAERREREELEYRQWWHDMHRPRSQEEWLALAAKAHWTDVVWRGDEIIYVSRERYR